MLPVVPPFPDLQRSSTDRGTARIGVIPSQRQRTTAQLHQLTVAADHAAKCHCVAPVKRQSPVIGDAPSNAPGRTTIANL